MLDCGWLVVGCVGAAVGVWLGREVVLCCRIWRRRGRVNKRLFIRVSMIDGVN